MSSTVENLNKAKQAKLRKLSFFQHFSETVLIEVFQIARWQNHAANQQLVGEGEEGDHFFILVEGEVKVSRHGKTLNILGPGDCFGEMAYLQSLENMVLEFPLFDQTSTRTADVHTITPATTISISTEDLGNASLECQRSFDRRFLSVLLERLMQANARLSS